MAVWRQNQNSTACESTAWIEARSKAKETDYLSPISYMLSEVLKLGKRKEERKKYDNHFTKKCVIFNMKDKPTRTDLKEYQPVKTSLMEYPQRCLIKGQTLQRSDGQCLGDYLGNWIRVFGYPKEVQVNSMGTEKMSDETRNMLRLMKDVLYPKTEEVCWPLKVTEVQSRVVKWDDE